MKRKTILAGLLVCAILSQNITIVSFAATFTPHGCPKWSNVFTANDSFTFNKIEVFTFNPGEIFNIYVDIYNAGDSIPTSAPNWIPYHTQQYNSAKKVYESTGRKTVGNGEWKFVDIAPITLSPGQYFVISLIFIDRSYRGIMAYTDSASMTAAFPANLFSYYTSVCDGGAFPMSGYAACIRPYIDGEMPDLPVDPSLPQPEPVPAPQPNPIFELVPDDYKVPGFLVADLEAASIEDLMKSYIDGNLTPDAYINLMSEELEPKKFIFDVKSYSVDGSSTWVRKPPITPSSNKISNLLNKESELVLADGYFDLSRDPSTRYVIFPKIEARPKYNKLVVNYLAEHTFSNVLFFGVTTPNRWTPTEKSNNIRIYDGVMVKIPSNTTDPNFPNFIADSNKWYYMPNLGFDVKTLTSTGKTIKDKYTYASLPIAEIEVDDYLYVPSSKWEKFTVSGEQKAPRYKINYKTETHKLKKGDIYSIDGGTTYVGPITETKGITLSVSQVIDSGGSIQIRKIPTTKKSASAVQVINPASRKLLNNVTLTPIKGKIASTNLKNYEIKNPATGKWGKLPKVTGNMEFEIRLKSTAKVAKTITTGNAASSSGKLVVTYGEYSNGKFGITAAEIIP